MICRGSYQKSYPPHEQCSTRPVTLAKRLLEVLPSPVVELTATAIRLHSYRTYVLRQPPMD